MVTANWAARAGSKFSIGAAEADKASVAAVACARAVVGEGAEAATGAAIGVVNCAGT